MIAASKAAMRGATILKATDDKTKQLNKHTLVAFSGEAGDTGTFTLFLFKLQPQLLSFSLALRYLLWSSNVLVTSSFLHSQIALSSSLLVRSAFVMREKSMRS